MRHFGLTILILAGIALVLFPVLADAFQVYLATEIIVLAIFGVSFYLLLGHTGYLSFGHAAYFGVGAYCMALCQRGFPDTPLLLLLLIGGLGGLLSGGIIGLFLLRLSKIYFSLATVAFGQMLWALAWKARSITGGDDGLTGWSGLKVHIWGLGTFALNDWLFLFYFVLALGALLIGLCWMFTRTPLGNTLACIKSNADRVPFLGINPYVPKLVLFSLAGFVAGFSGALYAIIKRIVSPNMMDMVMSFDVVIMNVLGGYGSFWGPIVGSAIYVYLSEFLSSLTDDWQLILGVIIVLIVMFSPNGAIGMAKAGWERCKRKGYAHGNDPLS